MPAGTRKLDLSCMESAVRVSQCVSVVCRHYIPVFDLYSMTVVDGRFRARLIVSL